MPTNRKSGPPRAPAATVHTIKVTLAGSQPPIWRRLQVPSTITLRDLHDVLQLAFGWEDYHLWVFETRQGRYGLPDRDLGISNAASKQLGQAAPRKGSRLGYTYDFGDDWEHAILLEAITSAEPGIAYPRCLTGQRAGPPEDCGGIWGYDYLIEILTDPKHEEHQERLEWLGLDSADQFDPTAFDHAQVNTALARLATVLIKD